MTHKFNPTILREYDIRGIVGDTLNETDAYALGRTYAAKARDEGARRIAVGRDGRTHSGALEASERRIERRRADDRRDAWRIGHGPCGSLLRERGRRDDERPGAEECYVGGANAERSERAVSHVPGGTTLDGGAPVPLLEPCIPIAAD